MCARTFARRLSRIWRSRSRSPCTSNGDRRIELDLAARVERARCLDCVAGHVLELDGLALERPALVEPGEQEEVVDQEPHPPGLALDAVHRPLEIVRALAGAAVEELGIGPHGGKRRAQLVRRVGDEAAQPVLGRGALVERLLDLAEHRVERPAEAPDLGARVVVLDALREVAAGDRGSRLLDPAERPQADADEPEAEEEDGSEHRGGDRQLDDQQLVQRVIGLFQRCRDGEELVRALDRLELHPEARVAIHGVDRERAVRGRGDRCARSRAGRAVTAAFSPGRVLLPAHWTVPFGDGADVEPWIGRCDRVDGAEPGPGPRPCSSDCVIASALAVAVRSTRSTRKERSCW